MRRILMAGVGDDMHLVYAEHDGDMIEFAATVRDGRVALVRVPVLSVEEGRTWILRRLRHFGKYPDSRESAEEAIRRKALAAQGRAFITRVKKRLTSHEAMELPMMFSAESHTQATDLRRARRANPMAMTVSKTGVVTGLPDPDLRDTEGRHLHDVS